MALIDREELLKTLCNFDYVKWYYSDLVDAIINMPTVDAEPVVRCKDCYLHGNCSTEDVFVFAKVNNPYCCVGKLKDGE